MTDHNENRFTKLVILVAGLDQPTLWSDLFRQVDQRGFLAGQVTHFQRFDQTAQDLETHILPAVVRLGDWPRYVHYFLVAANLRGLAEALAEPEILAALARSERHEFALEIAARLPDPERRARARVAIATTLRNEKPRTKNTIALREDLEGTTEPESVEAAEAWCQTLELAARALAREHQQLWPQWIERLARWPPLADRAWLALAQGYLAAGDHKPGSGLGQALDKVQDQGAVAAALVESLARQPPTDPWPLLRHIATHFGGAEPAWRLLLALARSPVTPRTELPALFARGLAELGQPRGSVDLMEAGSTLWRMLRPGQIEAALAAAPSPEAAAALAIAAWDAEQQPARWDELRLALERLAPGGESLRLYLALLRAGSSGHSPAARKLLGGVSRHLFRQRYEAPLRDLVGWLDLVARLEPKQLRFELENLLWSPRADPTLLHGLVSQASEPALLDELLARAERHAASACLTEAEGFELRREMIVRLTARLCAIRGNLDLLPGSAERLLPEEEDELRAALVDELATTGRGELAQKAAEGIHNRRMRLLALLQAHRGREIPSDLLTPVALYEAVVNIEAIEDELAGLAALGERPANPERVAAVHLANLHQAKRRIEALVSLGWQALSYQRRQFTPKVQDRLAAILPLRQALGVVPSKSWLLRLAPELVELGGQLGPRALLAELQEGVERIVQLEAAPWHERAAVLERLLARLPQLLRADWPGIAPHAAARDRIAASFLRWFGELPDVLPPGDGREKLRAHWHEVLPQVVALLERLPRRTRLYLAHPLRAWFCFEGLRVLTQRLGEERSWELLARWEARLGTTGMRRWFSRLWASGDPFAEAVLQLGEGHNEVKTLAYLLSAHDAQRVVTMLGSQPGGPERDDLCARLVSNRWLRGAEASQTAMLIEDRQVRLETCAWLGEPGTASPPWDETWEASMASSIALSALTADDPRKLRLERRLRQVATTETVAHLAHAGIASLESGGRPGADEAMRWFLQAWFAAPGATPSPTPQNRDLANLRAAAEKALSLRGVDQGEAPATSAGLLQSLGPEGEEPGSGDSAPSASERGHLWSIWRNWRKVNTRKPRAFGWTEDARSSLETTSGLVGLGTVTPLTLIDSLSFQNFDSERGAMLDSSTLPEFLWALVPFAIQAVIIDRLLNERFFSAQGTLQWRRWLRLGFAGIPVFGLMVIPACQWLWERQRRGETASTLTAPRCNIVLAGALGLSRLVSHPFTKAGRWLVSAPAAASLLLVCLMPLVTLPFILSVFREDYCGPIPCRSVLALTVHVASAVLVGTFLWLHSRASRLEAPRRLLLLTIVSFWLFPLPSLPLGGLLVLWLTISFLPEPARTSLSGRGLPNIAGLSSSLFWSGFTNELMEACNQRRGRALLHRPGELRRTRPRGSVERGLFLFLRWKVTLLFFEAGALAWVLGAAREAQLLSFASATALLTFLRSLALIGLFLGVAALTTVLTKEILLKVSRPQAPTPLLLVGRHLACSQLAFLVGLYFGEAVVAHDPRVAGCRLALLGFLGFLANLVPFVVDIGPDSPHQVPARVLASLGYAWLGLYGQGLSQGWSDSSLSALGPYLWLSSILSVLVGLGYLRWLACAVGRKEMGCQTTLFSKTSRPRLLVVALLPLGGLAAPQLALAWGQSSAVRVDDFAGFSPEPGR